MFIARTAIAFAAATLIAAPAFASDPAKPAAQETPAPVAKEKKFCVAESLTGSRLTTKTCKTRNQWLKEDNFDPLTAK